MCNGLAGGPYAHLVALIPAFYPHLLSALPIAPRNYRQFFGRVLPVPPGTADVGMHRTHLPSVASHSFGVRLRILKQLRQDSNLQSHSGQLQELRDAFGLHY